MPHGADLMQALPARLAQLAWLVVDEAQRAQFATAHGFEGVSGIEADTGFGGNQGVVGKARGEGGVRHHLRLIVQDGVSAKRDIPRGFRRVKTIF